MSFGSLALIGAAIFVSSLVSGVFGIAGAMILLGVLLVFFDVSTAMVMLSLLTTAGNTWRVVAWWRYVDWSIWRAYILGAAVAVLIGAAIFVSSLVSGVFGIAGAMILLGVLLVFFDVSTAMVMQTSST